MPGHPIPPPSVEQAKKDVATLEKLVVTNTIPQHAACGKVEVIDVGVVLGEVIRRSHYGESISALFNEVPY